MKFNILKPKYSKLDTTTQGVPGFEDGTPYYRVFFSKIGEVEAASEEKAIMKAKENGYKIPILSLV